MNRLTSYDRYYTGAVIRAGGIPILLSVLSYPSKLKNASNFDEPTTQEDSENSLTNSPSTQKENSEDPSQILNSSSTINQNKNQNNNNNNNNMINESNNIMDLIKKHILHEQLWLNCSIILHNLSFSYMAKKVMHLLSATDGFPIMCNCLRLCRDKISTLSTSTEGYCSTFFRNIALARTSTIIIQVYIIILIICN